MTGIRLLSGRMAAHPDTPAAKRAVRVRTTNRLAVPVPGRGGQGVNRDGSDMRTSRVRNGTIDPPFTRTARRARIIRPTSGGGDMLAPPGFVPPTGPGAYVTSQAERRKAQRANRKAYRKQH